MFIYLQKKTCNHSVATCLRRFFKISWFGVLAIFLPVAAFSTENIYLDFDITELMDVTITSATKKPQSIQDTAAAAFVITQEDIHRSGVTSIPEALRMVPGLQVARISSNKWAITSRGFNGQFASKLLVMIDGRTVYSPLYSGAYWDTQHTFLPDIERIEVIRGPGATMWGANAVNGVINIITKSARDTAGGLIEVGGGNEEQYFGGGRYGYRFSENVYGRAYITGFNRDENVLHSTDDGAGDAWFLSQAGFRFDGESGASNEWTFQGDVYQSDEDQIVSPYWTAESPYSSVITDELEAEGANLLARWQKNFSEQRLLQLQVYYDYTSRTEQLYGQQHGIFDFDIQYEDEIAASHHITLGAGFRSTNARYDNTFQVSFTPDKRSDELYNAFMQDEIALADQVTLTLGAKWEHNSYTGHEIQPSARVLWNATESQTLWAAVSRAVRTPSQMEDNGHVVTAVIPYSDDYTAIFSFNGSSDYTSEEIIAYEAGWRGSLWNSVLLDATVFYNDYDDLVSISGNYLTDGTELYYSNDLNGDGYGFELSAAWHPGQKLDFELAYTYLELELEADEGATILGVYEGSEGTSPRHQVSLRSGLRITETLQFNCWLRYMGRLELPNGQDLQADPIAVDAYLTMDVNLMWQPAPQWELSLVGQNLFNPGHLEYVAELATVPTEIERSVYARLRYSF